MYTDWYVNKNSYRQLSWIHSLGEITLLGRYGKKSYDIMLTTIQGIVLLLFSEVSQELTIEDIVQRSGVSDKSTIKALLHSLSTNPKYKLLSKTGNPKAIGNEDRFKSNGAFANNLKKFRVPAPSLDSSSTGSVNAEVRVEREVRIDAAVVRIAKARKTVSHNDLIVEVLHQLQFFQPEKSMIKQRIGHLIEGDYLKRNENDSSIYEYIA